MRIRLVRAEVFHADRRTDGRKDEHDKANSRFSQFCEKRLKSASFFIYNAIDFR